MKLSQSTKTIILVSIFWAVLTMVSLIEFLPQTQSMPLISDFVRQFAWLLIGFGSLLLAVKERTWRNKALFLNLFLVGGVLRAFDIVNYFNFFGLVEMGQFTKHYLYQYFSCGIVPLSQIGAIVFAGTVVLVNRISAMSAYGAAVVIVLAIGCAGYHPYLSNAKYLYTTNDIVDFRIIDKGLIELKVIENREPDNETVAGFISLPKRINGKRVRDMTQHEKVERIKEIRPYIKGNNYLMLLFKPIHQTVSILSLYCFVLVLSVLVIKIFLDPPQSAYMDRIFMAFLMYFGFEAFHYYVFSQTIEIEDYWNIFAISALMSILSLALVPPFLAMRLRFTMSAVGNYYEEKIGNHSSEVSRWRDEIDDFALRFIANNKRSLLRRLFMLKTDEKEHK